MKSICNKIRLFDCGYEYEKMVPLGILISGTVIITIYCMNHVYHLNSDWSENFNHHTDQMRFILNIRDNIKEEINFLNTY